MRARFGIVPLALLMIVSIGCSPPRFEQCEVTCGGVERLCPSGSVCREDGFCHELEDAELCAREVVGISAGRVHTCVSISGGAARCWGVGDDGRLGYGRTDHVGDDITPAEAGDIDTGGTVSSIAAGGTHTCALLLGGDVRCWGRGSIGQLGYGNTDNVGDSEAPAVAGDVDLGGVAEQITAGEAHTCALMQTGRVRCWGNGNSGRLGYGNTDSVGDDITPAVAGDVDIGGPVEQISAGKAHTCALLEGGTVRCWGDGGLGKLGYGHGDDIGDDEAPATAGDVDVGGIVQRVVAGSTHTCALLASGNVRCWGLNGGGQLGYGHTDTIGDDESPATAGDVDVGGIVTQVSAQGNHTCVVIDGARARCWGSNYYGQLGYGHTDNLGNEAAPASAGDVNVGGAVLEIAIGSEHTCALLEGGSVRCWGRGLDGRLGYGNTDDVGDDELPVAAGDVPVL